MKRKLIGALIAIAVIWPIVAFTSVSKGAGYVVLFVGPACRGGPGYARGFQVYWYTLVPSETGGKYVPAFPRIRTYETRTHEWEWRADRF